jgi:hypothetical protein
MITLMKKFYLLLLVLSISTAHAQKVYKIAQTYYRINPFNKEFNSFLIRLMDDPVLTNKTVNKKTDSTLFFLEGTYTSHSPFFFKATRTSIILAEREHITDSTGEVNNIFLYQLVGYAPPGKEGVNDIQKEFDKFCNRFKKGPHGVNIRELKLQNKKTGEIRDYLLSNLVFSPLTIAWSTSKNNEENIFAITVRFTVVENRAYLPIPADGL